MSLVSSTGHRQHELCRAIVMSTEDREGGSTIPRQTPTMIPMADLMVTIRDEVNKALSARLPPSVEGSDAGSSRGKTNIISYDALK